MPRIFISYRQADSSAVASRLCAQLRKHYGPRVFMNIDQVPLGADFRTYIAKEVSHSDVVLVLIGPRWLEIMQARIHEAQDFVRGEIEIALAQGSLTVPVLIGEQATIPVESELPPSIAKMSYLNGFLLDPSGDFDAQVKRLVDGLSHALSLRTPNGLPAAKITETPVSTSAAPEIPKEKPSPEPEKRRLEFLDMDLVWVEPGSFMMGSPENEPGRWEDEGPRHKVEISQGFWIGAHPVTQDQFRKLMETNPSFFKKAGGDAPVEMVSWNEANAFCGQLEVAEPVPKGFQFRLPSEAEWEYACRAGSESALYNGPMEFQGAYHASKLNAIAWYGGNSGVDYDGVDSSSWFEKQFDHQMAGTHPAGGKLPNAWGLFDMLGNVWEWCQDGKRTYQNSAVNNPVGPSKGARRVIRGGSWEDAPGDCRCATRFTAGEDHRFAYLGFRLVLAPPLNAMGVAS